MSDAPTSGTAARRARQVSTRAGPVEPCTPPDPEPVADQRDDAETAAPAPTRRTLDPDRLAALEDERDFLLRSLEDLEREHDAGDVDDVDHLVLRDDYVARAASVLRAIEERNDAVASAAPPRSRTRAVVVAALVTALALGSGVLVARSAEQRQAGDALTGDVRQTNRDRLLDAQRQFSEGNFFDAIKTYDTVVADQPSNAEALAYRGWLLRLVATQAPAGEDRDLLLASALRSLDAAVQAQPSYPDARVFRAVLLRDAGRVDDARTDLEVLRPGDVPPFMNAMVDNLRGQVGLAPVGVAAGSVVPEPTR